jgi:mRNA interferase MazF
MVESVGWAVKKSRTSKGSAPTSADAASGPPADSDLGAGCSNSRLCSRSTPSVCGCWRQPPRSARPSLHRCNIRLNALRETRRNWTVSGAKDYAGKPRPAVILQDDRFDMTASITICAFTTGPTDAPLIRLPPMTRTVCDALQTHGRQDHDVSKSKLGTRLGRLADEDLVALNRAVLVFLGIAGRNATPDRMSVKRHLG